MPIKPVISIVDDDASVREGMMDLLTSKGYIAETFSRAEDFLKSKRLQSTYCLITDVQMLGMNGLELYKQLVSSGSIIPTILITAFPNDSDRTHALRDGVLCYLAKPFTKTELLSSIRSAIERSETETRGP